MEDKRVRLVEDAYWLSVRTTVYSSKNERTGVFSGRVRTNLQNLRMRCWTMSTRVKILVLLVLVSQRRGYFFLQKRLPRK